MKKLIIKRGISIRKKVYDYLREGILNGHFTPNERLVESKIAAQIGTSRTPVREALHSLEREKLIRSIPNFGYIVNPLNQDDVIQICEIRNVIEGLAIKWAIGKAHKRLVRELSKNIKLSEALDLENKARDFIELDAQFHEIIARLSGSERLLELSQTLRQHMLRYRAHSIFLKEVVERAIRGHKLILEAIKQNDLPRAIEAMASHLEQAKIDTLKYGFQDYKKTENG